MPFVNVGGVSMHYRHRRAAGEAPALVFINSLGTDFRIWDEVTDRLASDVTILNYDKRGHGLSGLGSGVASMDDHVDDLAGLLDHLGIDDVILCGLSIGGLIAQGFATRRPQALRALIGDGPAETHQEPLLPQLFGLLAAPGKAVDDAAKGCEPPDRSQHVVHRASRVHDQR